MLNGFIELFACVFSEQDLIFEREQVVDVALSDFADGKGGAKVSAVNQCNGGTLWPRVIQHCICGDHRGQTVPFTAWIQAVSHFYKVGSDDCRISLDDRFCCLIDDLRDFR